MPDKLPRPPFGGTLNGIRTSQYDYWRVGYGEDSMPGLDFWVERAGEFHCKANNSSAFEFEMDRWTRAFYVTEGGGVYTFERRIVELQPGDLLVVPPNHDCVYSTSERHCYHWVALAGKWPEVWGASPRIMHTHLGLDIELAECFESIREILILQPIGAAYQALSAYYRTLARIEVLRPSRRAARKEKPESSYPEIVRNALTFLGEHCTQSFDSATVAAYACVSQSHLRSLFDRWIGESPKQVHTRLRIERAKQLIAQQQLPIQTVASHAGFGDVRHFSRVFKQVVGLPPSAYARSLHNVNDAE